MRTRASIAAALMFVAALGCSEKPGERHQTGLRNAVTDSSAAIWRVQEFRRLVKANQTEIAQAFMASNPRRWYENREGIGEPWVIAPGAGSWAAWDEHFHSRSDELRASGDTRQVTILVRETNDYYRLLDRGPGTTELVYFLGADGKIDGLLVRAAGVRVPGRTQEFLEWARREAPQELDYLRPNGEIDPTGDRPVRFRKLLLRWRAAAGLPPID
jgi:hypothetical protein